MSQDEGKDGDRGGSGGTIAGLLAVIAIVALGIWLMNELADSAKYARCAESRRHNCDTIDYRSAPSPPPQQQQ